MYGKHTKKTLGHWIFRGVAVCLLAVIFCVASFGTVMANTVSANVIDGDKSFTFSMNSTDLHEVLAQAQALGLEPLGPLDVAERVENTTTVNIRRGIPVTVTEAGKCRNLVAYKGDTVANILEDNNILLKAEDQIIPSEDTVATSGLSIEIRRLCRVTVTADGKSQQLSLTDGTVGSALLEAGVTLSGRDSANYEMDEPLFDKMHIRVSRAVRFKVTADGETGEYEVSGGTVLDALKKCGIELSEDDRLNVDRSAVPTDGMHIVVSRVSVEEAQETEEIGYSTEYEFTDDLDQGETQVLTPGEAGEKIVTYKLTYVDGVLESKEATAEEIVKEAVAEVILRGTKVPESSESIPVTGDNTFTDADGNVITYVKKLVGECTAACIPGGTTAIGMVAQRGVIAVDPSVIPYGTRMYVTSPDGSIVYGYGVAGDTGGAMLSGQVLADLYYDTVEECSIIGRRDMVIYILD